MDELPALASGTPREVTTRYGTIQVIGCSLGGHPIWFLPRHGVRHSTPPHSIDYRAQVAGLKELSVERIIGICSVGSLSLDLAPGSFAVLKDFVDLTRQRANTFFDGAGEVVHTDFTRPYCPQISQMLIEACKLAGAVCRTNAVYVGVDGPRYESPAEVRLFASWGGHVVGMTNIPEVVLAREAGMCYGALAVVTNYAAGLSGEPLSHDGVRAAVSRSEAILFRVLDNAVGRMPELTTCECCRSESQTP